MPVGSIMQYGVFARACRGGNSVCLSEFRNAEAAQKRFDEERRQYEKDGWEVTVHNPSAFQAIKRDDFGEDKFHFLDIRPL